MSAIENYKYSTGMFFQSVNWFWAITPESTTGSPVFIRPKTDSTAFCTLAVSQCVWVQPLTELITSQRLPAGLFTCSQQSAKTKSDIVHVSDWESRGRTNPVFISTLNSPAAPDHSTIWLFLPPEASAFDRRTHNPCRSRARKWGV